MTCSLLKLLVGTKTVFPLVLKTEEGPIALSFDCSCQVAYCAVQTTKFFTFYAGTAGGVQTRCANKHFDKHQGFDSLIQCQWLTLGRRHVIHKKVLEVRCCIFFLRIKNDFFFQVCTQSLCGVRNHPQRLPQCDRPNHFPVQVIGKLFKALSFTLKCNNHGHLHLM